VPDPQTPSRPLTQIDPADDEPEGPSFPMTFHEPLVPDHVSSDQPETTGHTPTMAIPQRFETPVEEPAPTPPPSTLLPVAYSPPEPSEGPFQHRSPFVRIMRGQVGIYSQGAVVPVAAFPDVKRLFDLGVVEWADPDAQPTDVDENAAIAVTLSRPMNLPKLVQRAPWVQAAPSDLMGPAVPRPSRADVQSGPMPAFQTINVAR
jgi:hypothetical protein